MSTLDGVRMQGIGCAKVLKISFHRRARRIRHVATWTTYCSTSRAASIGRACSVPERLRRAGAIRSTQHVCIIRPAMRRHCAPLQSFWLHSLSSLHMMQRADSIASKAARRWEGSDTPVDFCSFRVALPFHSCRRAGAAIVESLWTRLPTTLTPTIARTPVEQIKLMGEYRTRLVADVVTGKLDVRATAGQLSRCRNDEGEDWPEDAPSADFLDGR